MFSLSSKLAVMKSLLMISIEVSFYANMLQIFTKTAALFCEYKNIMLSV